MTPEEAIVCARAISRPYGPLAPEVESEALYQYVLASRAWRADGGASHGAYVRWRMKHAPREVFRKWTPPPRGLLHNKAGAAQRERSEPRSILALLAKLTTPRAAEVAWLYWGLEYTLQETGTALGITKERVWQLLRLIERKLGIEPAKYRSGRHTAAAAK